MADCACCSGGAFRLAPCAACAAPAGGAAEAPASKKRKLPSAAEGGSASAGSARGTPSAASASFSASFSAVLLGTGASNRVPRLDHVMSQDCAVCTAAASDPANRNRRNNVSLLL